MTGVHVSPLRVATWITEAGETEKDLESIFWEFQVMEMLSQMSKLRNLFKRRTQGSLEATQPLIPFS